MTGDETWFHYYEPETKEQSRPGGGSLWHASTELIAHGINMGRQTSIYVDSGVGNSRQACHWHTRPKYVDIIGKLAHFIQKVAGSWSRQWKRRDKPVPIKAKSQISAGKRMATVFWDRERILLLDWLPEKTSINSDYYVEELKQLREKIKSERRCNLNSRVLL